MAGIRFGVLGPVAVASGQQLVTVAARRLRILLGVLVCAENRPVSRDQLIDALWDAVPPRSAATNLRVYVHQLRQLLPDGSRLAPVEGGYRLEVAAGELDADQFTTAADAGRRALAAGRHETAASELRRGLELWRGDAYGDVADLPAIRGAVVRLAECRIAAVEDRVDADLALGRHPEVAGELAELVAAYPLRERPRGQLMLALYRCQRQAEALAVYRDTRHLLVTELGIEPCQRLQEIHQSILAGSPVLLAEPVPAAEETYWSVAQLATLR